ncbi:LysR family transcriptional regulator [Rhodoferax sp. GW822-FHT02A01]|uniref:LysR family transcriptional regulator n=1 Tax=Rhodoferax sp. GW822-FHT02A01 TaxID=3141537 RepID=UPI00315C5350
MPHNPAMPARLDDIALFTRIAELGTLSAAARERNIPVSQVTRSLKRLEASCGMRLLHRSTHGLSLTDEGDTLLDYGRRMLDLSADLDSQLSGKLSGPNGWVRVAVSPLLAHCVIAPSLAGLYQLHPDLHIEIQADDRMVDMVRDGIDIAFRTGSAGQDSLVARKVGEHGRSLYAAPSYLAQKGTPQHPDELERHHLIGSSVSPWMNQWTRSDAGEIPVYGHTRTDNSALMMSLVVQGVGIGRLNDLMARPLVQAGSLVQVLPGYFSSPRFPIYAVMQQGRQRLPKIRACIDYWSAWIGALG